MSKFKGENYIYFENSYNERNYPYIPVPIECDYSYYNRANRLDCENVIGIYDISEDKNYIKGYCLMKDLDRVSKILKLNYDVVGNYGKEYLDWLHDGLCDEFGEAEVEKSNWFEWVFNIDTMREMREKKIHKVIHYILDNIDKYYGYFIRCDFDYEWLYGLYDDAKDGDIDSRYIIEGR